ncbi:MAG: hypothetical protein ACNA8W_11630 [Bradymonadaceae bacterium]
MLERKLAALFALILTAVFTIGLSSPVEAQTRTKVALEVSFDALEVTQTSRGVVIEYAISRSDWRQLQSAKLSPTLNLFLPDRRGNQHTLHSGQTLTEREGRLVYRGAEVNPRRGEVSLELFGENRRSRIARMTYGERGAEQIVVTIHHRESAPENKPRRRDRVVVEEEVVVEHDVIVDHQEEVYFDYGAEIIRACKQHTSFSTDFDACLARGYRLPTYTAVSTIHACGENSSFGTDMTRCLDIAQTYYLDPTYMIRACGQVTSFATDMHSCMRATAPAQHDSTSVIQACGNATSFGSDLIQCVERSSY